MTIKRMSVSDFVRDAKAAHGDIYDYSRIKELPLYKEKVEIVCKIHGAFWQQAGNHKQGKGCFECGKLKFSQAKTLDTKTFIKRAKQVHGNTYSYKKSVYTGQNDQIVITCKTHGEFTMQPANHWLGKGCFRCAADSRGVKRRGRWVSSKDIKNLLPKNIAFSDTRSEFSQYHYAQLVCKTHGNISSSVARILAGKFCGKCSSTQSAVLRYDAQRDFFQRELIKKLESIYGDKYLYDEVSYIRATKPVTLICPKHGPFEATPNDLTAPGRYKPESGIACQDCRGCVKTTYIRRRKFTYKGYEILGVKHLIQRGIRAKDITTDPNEIPVIDIKFKLKSGHTQLKHFPDIYVASQNLLVEVKSPGTFGFNNFYTDGTELIRLLKEKRRRAIEQGFNYEVMLFLGPSDAAPVSLPEDWFDLKIQSLRKWWRTRAQQT